MASRTDPKFRITNEAILGVVLAGGKSSRMGTDKAKLVLSGKTLLQHQVEKLELFCGNARVVVSGRYPDYNHVEDVKKDCGPLAGIYSVIKKYHLMSYYLFLPVDMPYISVDSLNRLLQQAIEPSGAQCWTFEKLPMPVMFKNHSRLIPTLDYMMLQPSHSCSVNHLCKLLNHQSVTIKNITEIEFLNTNTIKDWKKGCDEHKNVP